MSVVSLKRARSAASTVRIDPEYFQGRHLDDAAVIASAGGRFATLDDLSIRADASAFYPSIEDFYGQGSLPFLRVGDVDGFIDMDNCEVIPRELCDKYSTLSMVSPGDIVFTKGGAIDRVGFVTGKAAASRDLIFLDTSKIAEDHQKFLFSYFCSEFFRGMLVRSSSQTAQPHLTVTLVRALPILKVSGSLQTQIALIVTRALEEKAKQKEYLAKAESYLLASIGSGDWSPPDPLTYTATASSTLRATRLDAQFFSPRYANMLSRLEGEGQAVRFGEVLTSNVRGNQPGYAETGLPVVNSKHVRTNRIDLSDHNLADPSQANVMIQYGDLLLNGTGVGTIGRAAPWISQAAAIPDNHVTVLRTDELDPIYLSVFLNSRLGQMQVERHTKGSSGQVELYPSDIAKFVIWLADEATQKAVRQSVLDSFAAETKAQSLLYAAKRAVEIAIRQNEATALRFLAATTV